MPELEPPVSTSLLAVVLDPLELAWAAGFFDGEGSTIVHKDESRPGYLRLEAVVPQSGHGAGVPTVLIRFQKAVGGLCRIVGPEGRDMYKCVSSGRLEAMAIVALLWSQLGEVKRRQANEAIKTFVDQYEHADFAARVGRHAGRVFEVIGPSIDHETDLERLEIAWAAGFMDGEGCFGIARAGRRVNGPDWYRVRASATQHGAPRVVPEVLLRLHGLLGGRIECHGEIDDFKWVSEGDNNVERVLRLLEPFLGEIKAAEAHRALAAFRAQVRLKGNSTHCRRGHEYTQTALRGGRTRRICNPCARIIDRRKRAKQGIPPRAFKNIARRYTQ
jgi:hypothetical protein